MYSTAAELGIEPFLVDLRHLCAHGHALPALDIFRRSATYCMEWLKLFYWQPQSNAIENTGVQNVRLARVINYENDIRELFAVYDAATEASHKRIKYVGDIVSGSMVASSVCTLTTYSRAIKQTKLSIIVASTINHLTDLTCNSPKVRDNANLYCDHMFQCHYFVQTSGNLARDSQIEIMCPRIILSNFVFSQVRSSNVCRVSTNGRIHCVTPKSIPIDCHLWVCAAML